MEQAAHPSRRVSRSQAAAERRGRLFQVRIGELVDGLPARVWDYSAPADEFRLASDHAVGLRGRHGHPQSAPDDRRRSSLRARERRGGQQPTGHLLARLVPEPGASLGDDSDFKRIAALVTVQSLRTSPFPWRPGVRRFVGADRERVSLGGSRRRSGTSGNWARSCRASVRAPAATRAFSALDPQLERPYVNELTFGFESRARRSHDRPDDGDRPARGPARRRGQYRRPDSDYVPFTLIDPGVDHAGGQTVIVFNRPPARIRRGSLSADEPGRASRHVCRRRYHHADDDRPVVPDRRGHGRASGGYVGEPRLPGIRERSRAHRRGVHRSERGDQRARPPVHRARLHDQDGRRLSFLRRPSGSASRRAIRTASTSRG